MDVKPLLPTGFRPVPAVARQVRQIRASVDTDQVKKVTLRRGKNRDAETEGLFTYRVADRGRDHSDHRCDRHSEPAARAYCGERVVRGQRYPYHQHGRNFLLLSISAVLAVAHEPGTWRTDHGLPGTSDQRRVLLHRRRACF